MTLERAASYIKVTHPCLNPVAAMGKSKQIKSSNLQYMTDIIHELFMREIMRLR